MVATTSSNRAPGLGHGDAVALGLDVDELTELELATTESVLSSQCP